MLWFYYMSQVGLPMTGEPIRHSETNALCPYGGLQDLEMQNSASFMFSLLQGGENIPFLPSPFSLLPAVFSRLFPPFSLLLVHN